MDSLHTIGFYVSATISVGGGLVASLASSRGLRGLAVAVAGVGLAGLDLSLSAGFAAIVVLVAYAAIGWLISGSAYRTIVSSTSAGSRQVGAVAAGGLLVLLCYAAYRGGFVHATFNEGAFGATDLGRQLFAHDVPSLEAVAAIALVALVGATTAWWLRERGR